MSTHDEQPPGSSEEEFKPRAILIFLAIMFVGYVLYWAYVWQVTTIQRGGG